jgi:hypothetical protein
MKMIHMRQTSVHFCSYTFEVCARVPSSPVLATALFDQSTVLNSTVLRSTVLNGKENSLRRGVSGEWRSMGVYFL